jgi:flagellar motor switch/type III secretory pathway protein FliN
VEDLRKVFPGKWRFAIFMDPVEDRTGFLVLDPQLAGRIVSRVRPDRPAQAGWTLAVEGEDGVIGWVFSSALVELAGRDPEGFGSWRFAGLLDSAGQVGRACCGEDSLIATWLAVEAGWDRGFAIWIETASSAGRRRPVPGDMLNDIERVAELKLTLPVLAGTSHLTAEELLAIGVGDVVLLDGCHSQEEMSLRLGSWFIRGTLNAEQLIIESIHFCQGGSAMNPGEILSDHECPALGVADVGTLPVEITVEAGRVELTVSQVAALTAGDVVTLSGDVLGPVELRAGSTLVARGELVDVEGRRGVRILEVPPRLGGRDEGA